MRVKMTFAVAAFAALVLGLPASSYAKTETVKSGESIQAAIDKAKPGTTIKIEEGTYHESLLIKDSDIELVGSDRKSTKIVPPANPTPGKGCVFEDQRDPPPAPPVVVANGICVANVDDQFKVLKEVEDVHISNLSVTGFGGFGILLVGAEDGVVSRVIASDNDEYGIFANNSTGTVIARSVTANDGEAGIYVGDSPNADATVWKNVAYGSNFGIFIRDAAHGQVLKNKSFGNCTGILFLNTDETAGPPPPQGPPPTPIDVEDWVAKHNDATANNKPCPGGGDEPALSGIGIAVSGGIDVHLIDNGAFGNKPDPTTNSPVSGGIVVAEGSRGTRVAFNTALGNDPFDLVWDGTGQDNKFSANDCLTSQPDGLCVDEHGNDGDDENGDDAGHGDDHGDNGDHGNRAGDGDRGEHRSRHELQRKQHKHKKHKRHRRHNG